MGITALFTGSSGLQANSQALDVVGNNLANLNTVGYKSQRALFQDAVYQALGAGSPGTQTTGGTNAAQLGFGVVLGSVGTQFSQGVIAPSGNPLDAAIEGTGYFVLNNSTDTVFTRSGAFDVDANGFLVDPATGYFVQRTGLGGEATPTLPGFQVTGDNRIRVPFGVGAAGIPTTTANVQGNLSATLVANDPKDGVRTAAVQVYDSLSTARTLTLTFTKTAANTFDITGNIPGATLTGFPQTITFDTDGKLLTPATADFTINVAGLPGTSAQDIRIVLGTPGQADGVTQYGGATTIAAPKQDGLASGVLNQVSIDNAGNLQGQFSNGRVLTLATLATAGFNNEGGLMRVGKNYFVPASGSGTAIIGPAGEGGRGTIQGGALEGSNVDVSVEFSRLIVAQRGFQVNARTVTVANDTLQELANIIR